MLLDFPSDVFVTIIEQVTDQKDLKHLCEVSKSLQFLITPILYKSITVHAESEAFLEDIEVHPFMRICYNPTNLLQFVEAIEFTSRFCSRIQDRCIHNKLQYELDEDSSVDEEEEEGNSIMARLVNSVLPLLEKLSDGGLRNFAWSLGTCVPQQILGPFGHLALKQNNIESIRLITDGACSWNLDDQCPIALSAFKHLKILSWRGLRSENDLEALIGALRQNSNQLIELELDLIRCGLANTSFGTEEDDPNNFFARDILELPPGGTKQVFSALQILSLSAVSFSSAEENIASAFDFSSLRSLKLRFCPGWENLLYHAAHSNQRIRLESLEIQSSLEDVVQDAGDVVADFLQAFVGLRELFISTGSPEPTLDLWRSLLFHKSTLRRFVHHQRCLNIDYEAGNFEGEYDLPDLSFAPEDLAKLDEDQSQNPFGDLDLECIGLCCFPKFLKPILFPLATKHSLQVLHIRQSGSDLEHYASWGIRYVDDAALTDSGSDNSSEVDLIQSGQLNQNERDDELLPEDDGLAELTRSLHDFAQWAFGPSGFPSLRIIAFGDFSYGDRFYLNNVHLCRNSVSAQIGQKAETGRNFRRLAENDRPLWDLLDKYSNLLQACPTDPLFDD